MKNEAILKAMAEGRMFMICEFRSAEGDEMKWSDDKGRARHANIMKYNLESGALAFQLTEFLPDDAKPEDFKVPFTKGQPVVAEITAYSVSKGVKRCSGTLLAYTETFPVGKPPLAKA